MKRDKVLEDKILEVTRYHTGRPEDLKVALVTGATGLLGSTITLALAQKGWNIGIHFHKNREAAERLVERVSAAGSQGMLLQGDLTDAKAIAPRLVSQMSEALGHPHLLIHSACPPVISHSLLDWPEDLQRMFDINVTAYLALARVILPEMLRTQTGTVIAILSQALIPPFVPGWHAYTTAKAALAQAVNEVAAQYSEAGIRALSVLPGAVRADATTQKNSDEEVLAVLKKRRPFGLEATKVAELVLGMIEDPNISSGSALSIDPTYGVRIGRFIGWAQSKEELATPHVLPSPEELKRAVYRPQSTTAERLDDEVGAQLSEVFRDLFGLDSSIRLDEASVGTVVGWDSLGHIRLVMEVEKAFDVTFTSAEAVSLQTFKGLAQAIAAHRNGRNQGGD